MKRECYLKRNCVEARRMSRLICTTNKTKTHIVCLFVCINQTQQISMVSPFALAYWLSAGVAVYPKRDPLGVVCTNSSSRRVVGAESMGTVFCELLLISIESPPKNSDSISLSPLSSEIFASCSTIASHGICPAIFPPGR